MTIDESLLRTAIAVIEAKPETWDQSDWGNLKGQAIRERLVAVEVTFGWGAETGFLPEGVTCGTTMCLAGQVVAMCGFPLLYDVNDGNASKCINPQTREDFDVMTKAQRLLGLTDRQANRMFSGSAARLTAEQMDDYDEASEGLEEDSIELFKANITKWTGVKFDGPAST